MNTTVEPLRQELPACSDSPSKRLWARILSAATAVVLSAGLSIAGATPASADTAGYAGISLDQFKRPHLEFGIPAWVTSDAGTRAVATQACGSFVADKLKVHWFFSFVIDFGCGYAIDRLWQPNQSIAICGDVPMTDVRATRVWKC